jgi:hypothetical protein
MKLIHPPLAHVRRLFDRAGKARTDISSMAGVPGKDPRELRRLYAQLSCEIGGDTFVRVLNQPLEIITSCVMDVHVYY